MLLMRDVSIQSVSEFVLGKLAVMADAVMANTEARPPQPAAPAEDPVAIRMSSNPASC